MTGTPQGRILSPLLATLPSGCLNKRIHQAVEALQRPCRPGANNVHRQTKGCQPEDRPLPRRFPRPGQWQPPAPRSGARGGRPGYEQRSGFACQRRAPGGPPRQRRRLPPVPRPSRRRARRTSGMSTPSSAARPVRQLKAKIRALTHRTSQQDLRSVLIRINQITRGWSAYFRHAVAKNQFSTLASFIWWRLIPISAPSTAGSGRTSAAGSPTPPVGGGRLGRRDRTVRLANGHGHPLPWRGNTTPNPWTPQPRANGSLRGEPGTRRRVRRVRRAARRNGPGAIPAPRSVPTQLEIGEAAKAAVLLGVQEHLPDLGTAARACRPRVELVVDDSAVGWMKMVRMVAATVSRPPSVSRRTHPRSGRGDAARRRRA